MDKPPTDITVITPQSSKAQTSKDMTSKDMASKDKTGRAPWAYLLAAYAIWALIFYSLSPLSRTAPVRVAMRPIQICAR